MVDLAQLSENDLVYDLGCGDGRILVAAAKEAGCQAVGFDIDSNLVRQAREKAEANGVAHLVTVQQRDVLTVDLSQANVVMVYLLPWIMEELIPQFEQMKPGSRIIAHDFGIPGYKPDRTIELPAVPPKSSSHQVHMWVAPLRKRAARR
jgi:ribosomal protein L11 methylase PrmA